MRHNQAAKFLSPAFTIFICLAMLFSSVCLPAMATEVSDENLFSRRDPFFLEGYNYIQSTDQITVESESFITGYIQVTAGNIVSVNLNSTQNSEFIKYALYDSNRVWQDTVKFNDVSELTIRIFNDGYIRIAVYGLQFENTISIFTSADQQSSAALDQDTLLMSNNNTNIIVKTADEDESAYRTDRFDRNDPDYLDGYNFEQTSDVITEETDSFITGYISVAKGDVVLLKLNSDFPSLFVKYALYDTDKNWNKTVKTNFVSDLNVTMTDAGFIRFSIYGRIFKNTAAVYIHPALLLSADQQIEETIVPTLKNTAGQMELLTTKYLSGETIDLFNRNDKEFVMDQGFRQLTGDIVEDPGSFLTGYIPIVKGQLVIISFTQDSAFAKYAFFDSDKNWLTTTRVDHPTMLILPVEETGYFRFHGYGDAITGTTITIPTVTKVDINAVTGNVADRLERLEAIVPDSRKVDIVLFMGQSNMAGRGVTNEQHPEDAPAVIEGAGWEFRAISDPTTLYPIDKTFGLNENVADAIDDGNMKTGGMVPAFVNAYYTHNGNIPMIAVSASKGATSLTDWQPGTPCLTDAISRLNACVEWAATNNYEIRHKYMVWCQGESDEVQDENWYVSNFENMFRSMKSAGIEKCFMIRVGNSNPISDARIEMMAYQNRLCQTNRDVIMISNVFSTMLNLDLMKDNLHFYQEGYNLCGEDAGVNMAYYVTTGKEPMMYDPQFGNMYFSLVN